MRKEKVSLAYRNLRAYRLKRNVTKIITGIFLFVLIFGLSFVILYPFLKLLPLVFNSVDDIGAPDVVWIPKNFSFKTFQVASYLIFSDNLIMLKSLGYALSIALIQTFMTAMAGYTLARIDFKGRNFIFALVLITFIIPPQATLISQYLRFKDFDIFGMISLFNNGKSIDLINNPFTLYILSIFGFGLKQSLFIFIFRQFFLGVPNELEEAALIDGCGFYKTYFKVMLPNAIPAAMTVLVFSFVWNYGDTYYVNYFHPKGPYLSIILQRTFNEQQLQFVQNLSWSKFDIKVFTAFTFDAIKQSALIMYLSPLLILYFMIQKRFVENFERSGIVG